MSLRQFRNKNKVINFKCLFFSHNFHPYLIKHDLQHNSSCSICLQEKNIYCCNNEVQNIVYIYSYKKNSDLRTWNFYIVLIASFDALIIKQNIDYKGSICPRNNYFMSHSKKCDRNVQEWHSSFLHSRCEI